MGEMADDIIERMLFGPLPNRKRRSFQKGSGDFNWRTREGIVMNMYDMTPEHRANAINMCRRQGNSGKLKQLEQVQREMGQAKVGMYRHPQDDIGGLGGLDDDIPF